MTMSAVCHLIFRLVTPGTYAAALKKASEQRDKTKCRWFRRDIKGGLLPGGDGTSFEVGVNKETPLIRERVLKDESRDYIEIPECSDREMGV
jgi:hypothetical protein